MGINCKTLLILFGIVTVIKFVAYTDFIDPKNFLPDDSEMTDFAVWMWKFMVILILEIFLAVLFSVLFDDDAGHNSSLYMLLLEKNVRFTYDTHNKTCQTSMKCYCLIVGGYQAQVVKDYIRLNEVNWESDEGPDQDLVGLWLELSDEQ